MASDGLKIKALTGTCRMCLRARSTDKYLNAVGEVRHGYATGHIWECIDKEECDKAAEKKLNSGKLGAVNRHKIEVAKERGRLTEYIIVR